MYKDYLKSILQLIAPKYGLTLYAGFCANLKIRVIKNRLIRNFIKKYKVNMQESMIENIEDFACYNDFFTRYLKPECRPIASTDIVSPVDGYVSEFGAITSGKLIQAKGRLYSAEELLGYDEIYKKFNSGYFATLYLSPKDYHRIHMPLEGKLKSMTYIPGKLFSVQPATARVIPSLFAKNERLVVMFETKAGLMAMILVGAVIVGAIGTAWHGDLKRSNKMRKFDYSNTNEFDTIFKKAQEMGYFKLGSTVILLFTNDKNINWVDEIQSGKSICYGEALAKIGNLS
jgi:phosphatidylserine decarboxylase